MRISEIPNYTVKNRCFDMPISFNNSVTQQEVSACNLLDLEGSRETGSGNGIPEVEIPEIDLYNLRD